MEQQRIPTALLVLTLLLVASDPAGAQSGSPESNRPDIRDVRPPSCFTPGPERGLGRQGHVYGVFPIGDRVFAAVATGRDSTRILEIGTPTPGPGDIETHRRLAGETPGTLRAAERSGDTLTLWTEDQQFRWTPDGWSSLPNPQPELFTHHGSARTGTPIGIEFADFWVPMAWAWQWMTDLESGRRILIWNGRLSANNYDGPDRPGIAEIPRAPDPGDAGSLPPFHPLPTPTLEQYQRWRLEEPLDSLRRANLFLRSDFGAWQRVGDEIWFGVSFYLGEGADGVGGYGRFRPGSGKYVMEWGVPSPEHSVSALYHDGQALWLGLMQLREWGHPPGGVARVDLEDGSIRTYEVPGVVTVLCPVGNDLYAGSHDGLFRWDGGRFRRVWEQPAESSASEP